MAVQQRIIGGGLLLAGIAVVLILIFLPLSKEMPSTEAYQRLRNEIYPAYVKAEDAGDYVKLRSIAKEANELKGKTAMTAVLKEAEAAAATGDREARGLLKLLQGDAFDRNANDLYELDGSWYDSRSHTALRLLKRSLDEAVPALVDARRAAQALGTAIEQLRLGSGLEIPLPAKDAAAKHPVAAADAELFRGFALKPADIASALKAQGAGAKANTARLVWNQKEATADRARLAEEIAKLPRIADSIERAAVALGKADQDLKGRDDAGKQAMQYLKTASDKLAAALDAPARPAGEYPIGEIATALVQEARILKAVASNAPGLGQALSQPFAP